MACGARYAGALAGASDGKISGSWSTGIVSNAAGYGSQFPGRTKADQFAIRAGGLVGFAGSSSVIANSYTVARVSALSDWLAKVGAKAGGLVGQNSGSITASYAAGSVSTNRRANSEQFINVGGLVGHNSGTITASYAASAVSGGDGASNSTGRGGLVGCATGNSAVSDSYFDTDVSGSRSAAGAGKSTTELQSTTETSTQQNYTPYTGIYANWNVDLDGDGNADDPWDFGTASQYPVLSGLGVSAQRGHTLVSVPTNDYDIDDDGLIEVSIAYQLYGLRVDKNGDGTSSYSDWSYRVAFPDPAGGMGCPASGCVGYELANDLALDYKDPSYHVMGGPPEAEKDGYQAIFDGNGHTISNFRGGTPMHAEVTGLFGIIGSDGEVRNLNMTGAIVGDVFDVFVGALTGINYGLISNVHVRGEMDGSGYIAHIHGEARVNGHNGAIGGLAGLNETSGVIEYSSSAGEAVSNSRDLEPVGPNVGGLVGRNKGTIRASFSTAAAWGHESEDIGGLVGYNTGSIRASYATGIVYDRTTQPHDPIADPKGRYLGGLVGGNEGEITASYATGEVSNGQFMGGLVGFHVGGTVKDSYWNIDTAGTQVSRTPGAKSTEDLQLPWRYEGIYANWNLDLDGDGSPDDPWDFGSTKQYPQLKMPGDRQSSQDLRDAKTYVVTRQARVVEGGDARLTITLNRPAPTGGVEFTVAASYHDPVPLPEWAVGTSAVIPDAASADDVGNITSPVTVPEGDTTLEIDIPTVDDTLRERIEEFFTVTITASTSGWSKAGEGRDTATITVVNNDRPHR